MTDAGGRALGVVPVERLTAEDRIMLWPDALWPQDIGAIAILDGVRPAQVRAVLASRLHLVPRFRQLLVTPGRGLGGPCWADAAAFNLDDHLLVRPLPPGADEQTLLQAVESVRRQRLDRSRPLWQLCVFPGLPEGRVGLYVRMHHAIADGIAGIATIATFLDPVASPSTAPDPPSWRPLPMPTRAQLCADNLRQKATGLGRAGRTLGHPGRAAREVRAVWRGLRELFSSPAPQAHTSLNRVIGPDREVALMRARLDVVKRVAHSHHATVNDVLLAVAAGGLRALLSHRGEPVEDRSVRVDVPLTLRDAAARTSARGNHIGQMLVPVPIGLADPGQRLAQIAADTAVRKREHHPAVGVVLNSRLARRAMLKQLERNPVNVITADLIGPSQPVFLAGRRVLEVFPVFPLMANVSLGIGALSYAGQLAITVIADRDSYPDLSVFVAGAERELDMLTGVFGPVG